MRIIYLLALVPWIAQAAIDRKIEISHQGETSRLTLQGKEFTYQDAFVTRKISVQSCNQVAVEDFFREFDRQEKGDKNFFPPMAKVKPILLKKNGKNSRVRPSGSFGTWLRHLHNETLLLATRAEFRCQEKK